MTVTDGVAPDAQHAGRLNTAGAAVAGTVLDQARTYRDAADARATTRAYRSDQAHYASWCGRKQLQAFPAMPEIVSAYLGDHAATHSMATLRRRVVAIRRHTQEDGQQFESSSAVIRATLRGIAKKHGRPQRRAAAITTRDIRRMVARCGSDLAGRRDRALLLLGFAAALRRSELVALEREDILFTQAGMRVTIPRSKTDQAAEGVTLNVLKGAVRETCPVLSLQAWLDSAAIQYGPLFRMVNRWGTVEHQALSPGTVRLILHRRAAAAGVTGTSHETLSPHGLRAGFITTAYNAGVRDEDIMKHARHKSHATMRRYVRTLELANSSITAKLGL